MSEATGVGRPEKPIDAPRHRGALAHRLREIRALVGVTYEDMAQRSRCSAATHKRTASGTIVPRWPRVGDFLDACHTLGGPSLAPTIKWASSTHEVYEMWVMARREGRGTLRLTVPHPRLIADAAELSLALQAVYERAGAPPLREVQKRGGGPLYLPLSTLGRIVTRQTLPLYLDQLRAFLVGCGTRQQLSEWDEAWVRVMQQADLFDLEAVRNIRYWHRVSSGLQLTS
ncbi:helix-turn-helix domain-containing protein [Streptomyces sp. NPDC007856]|uniref:helix-turn-helix domain-containing protein n=1 Tax=Streptomyces sp. NPDC007856 TaxID=3364781 RepID=UPI0036D14755